MYYLLKVYAHLRKKDYLISASTWKEFCEELEHATGKVANHWTHYPHYVL